MRLIYRQELKRFSNVADHCVTFGLSNPIKDEFRAKCDEEPHNHQHDYVCSRCEMVKITMEEIKELITTKYEEVKNSNELLKLRKWKAGCTILKMRLKKFGNGRII